jgi:hypothetical protein
MKARFDQGLCRKHTEGSIAPLMNTGQAMGNTDSEAATKND